MSASRYSDPVDRAPAPDVGAGDPGLSPSGGSHA
jgi:hypothetical protein